jgi:hypothetical protein
MAAGSPGRPATPASSSGRGGGLPNSTRTVPVVQPATMPKIATAIAKFDYAESPSPSTL